MSAEKSASFKNGEKSGEEKKPGDRDGLAIVIGGLFIVALVFAAYSYFNKSAEQFNEAQKESVFQTDMEAEEEPEGDLNGNAASDTNIPDVSKSIISNGSVNSGLIKAEWTANDYKSGDIKGTSYTVIYGDTLWEIAEGAYGDGSQWTKILAANSSDIGFLANGQQALIVPGQVLVLP